MRWRELHREKECHDVRAFTAQEEEKDIKAEGVTSECLQHDE
jgi:peptide deformylase